MLRREKLNLDWSDPEYENLRGVAETIWQLCYSAEMTLEELCPDVPVCELKFFKTVLQLVQTGHFSLTPAQHGANVAVYGNRPGCHVSAFNLSIASVPLILGTLISRSGNRAGCPTT